MVAILYRTETADQATHRRVNLDPEAPMTTGHNSVDLGVIAAPDDHVPRAITSESPIAVALAPMELTKEEAEEMRAFIEQGTAYPKIPTRKVPEGDRSLLKREHQ